MTDATDPHWVLQPIAINAKGVSTISIRLSNHNDDTNGRVYFRRAGDDSFSEERSVSIEVHDTGNCATYHVDASANAAWSGTVTVLRVDPITAGSREELAFDDVHLDQ